MSVKLWRAFARRRVNEEDENKSELARVLGLFDLIALGVGATLGLGVYILAGNTLFHRCWKKLIKNYKKIDQYLIIYY